VLKWERAWYKVLATSVAVLLSASACSSDSRTVLTVYSPHGKDLLEYYEQAFEQAHPDVDVQWVDMGSQEVLDRLRAEKANPQADVWFGATAEIFERGASEGLLDAYEPTWSAQVPADAHDPGNFWYGTYLTPEVIAFNTHAVTEADAPKDWDDVLDAKWKGKVLIRDPIASGSMRAIFGGILGRSIAQTGNTAAGWEWLRRLDGNTKEYVLNPALLYQKLGREEGVITLYDMPDIATLQQRTKLPVGYVFPASGTPLVVDAIAIVHGARHPDVAKQFYEFVTTVPALTDAARKFVRIPVRADLPADSLPPDVERARSEVKPMPGYGTIVRDSIDTWMKYWDANIRNSRRGKLGPRSRGERRARSCSST
jgi:iron(III) transport system substrate-binding protein